MRVLVTRPAEDGAATAARLAAMGHQALPVPLLSTHFLEGPEPALDDVQAILATSANGVRALARRSRRRDVALFAVGPQTAEAASLAGFHTVRDAGGDASALAQAATRWARPEGGALLHVCGEPSIGRLADALTEAGFTLRKAVLYRVDAAEALPAEAVSALSGGAIDAALFFSPRSARVFAGLASRGNLPTKKIVALCISAAAAEALAPLRFADVRVAAQPNQNALLALLAR